MKKTNLKEKLSLVLYTVLIVAMALFTTGCSEKDVNSGANNGSQQEQQQEQQQEVKVFKDGDVIGEVDNDKDVFDVCVVTEDGKSITIRVFPDKDVKTVGEALLKGEFIAGEEGEYGLYVKTVNGVTADFDKDGKYWAFYIDDEYAQTGVDQTEIERGVTYTFKIEK